MLKVDFETVSQIAHFLAGTLAIILSAYLFGDWLWGAILLTLFALIKEFWWDLRNEDNATSGGIDGSTRDFGYYMLGGGFGMVLVWIKVSIA